jgi:HEAT repeat protein
MRQLSSGSAKARVKAAKELWREPNPDAVDGLAKALSRDPDAEVRQVCASALGRLQGPGRIEPLLKALHDKEPEVVKSAMLGLRRVSDQRIIGNLVPLLRHQNFSVRSGAAQAIDTLRWAPTDNEERIWFAVAKGWFQRAVASGADSLAALQLTVETSPVATAVRGVEALGSIPDPRAVKLLCRALNSPEPIVCIAAAGALGKTGTLGKLGGSDAVEALMGSLRSPHTQVRAESARALGVLGAVEAAKSITRLLQDQQWEVRREAASALGRLGDPDTFEPLATLLNDEDTDVREAAAMALGRLRDRRGIPCLVMALKDESASVRRIAAASLPRIEPDWVSLPETRAAAEELKMSIQDSDAAVRFFVAQLLVNLGEMSPEALEGFSPEDTMASPADKRQRIGTNLFIALLDDRDRDIRQAAAEALGRLGGERARQALTRAAADPDGDVANATQLALQASVEENATATTNTNINTN